MSANTNKLMELYSIGVVKRGIIIWLVFQLLLWVVFAVAYFLNQDAWSQDAVKVVGDADSVLKTFFIIIVNNLVLWVLIAAGNIFVRFGVITLGPIILLIQGIMIGIVAGSNSFEFPFTGVMEANLQYLKVGLWETTAYALVCAVTMTKSLYISDTFPAKQWALVRKWKELSFSKSEKFILVLSLMFLFISGIIEAVLLGE